MPHKKRDLAVAERFGLNLRRVRRREDLTQEELSELAGLHRNEIGRLENGERVPRIDTFVRLADSAGVPPVELLEGIYWIPAPGAVGTFTFLSGPDPGRQEAPMRKSGE